MRTKLTVTERVLFSLEPAPCVFSCSNWYVRFTEPNQHPEPSAEYPNELLAAGKEGMAVVEFVVAAEGSVKDAKVVKEDHPLFGEAALQAVKRWRFPQPMAGERRMHNGVSTPIYFIIKDESNQPPQVNAGSPPSSGEPSPSETPSSLGPRG